VSFVSYFMPLILPASSRELNLCLFLRQSEETRLSLFVASNETSGTTSGSDEQSSRTKFGEHPLSVLEFRYRG